tara:strand:- start:179 stop:382 length:204 start_codon:yes stop_codon:yes gene_type:complete
MGPYSEDRQYRRAAALGSAILAPNIDPDFRKIYELKLRSLARSEEQYIERVKQTYRGLRWNPFIGTV